MKFLARKEAKACLRKAGAKNLSPNQKNPPLRTSLRVFSAGICVKKESVAQASHTIQPEQSLAIFE
jgi:hypothetical protein